jgi:hypothetical protein
LSLGRRLCLLAFPLLFLQLLEPGSLAKFYSTSSPTNSADHQSDAHQNPWQCYLQSEQSAQQS